MYVQKRCANALMGILPMITSALVTA